MDAKPASLRPIIESARPADWRELATHRLAVMLEAAGALEDGLERVSCETAQQLAALDVARSATMRSVQQVAELTRTVVDAVTEARTNTRVEAVRAAAEIADRIVCVFDQAADKLGRKHSAALQELEARAAVIASAAVHLEKSLLAAQQAERQLRIQRAKAAHEFRLYRATRGAHASPWWQRLLRRIA